MFTKEEATEFITDKLKIKEPLRQFDKNRLVLLNNIIRAVMYQVPFQNITLLCLPEKDRKAPTMDEIKRDGISLVGGLCIVNNAILKNVLEAIGFDIEYVSATIIDPDSHVLCIASNVLHEGDKYLVDVGCGYPTFEAIPLDFNDESPIYEFSFMKFKLVRNQGVIERQHLRQSKNLLRLDSYSVYDQFETRWVKFYEFSVTPVEYCQFDSTMNLIYTVPDASPFLISIVLVSFKNGKCTVVRDNLHLEEGDDNKLHEVERLESNESIISCISKICPQLSELDIKNAVEIWASEYKHSTNK
ncbi:uncharacterized protein LOC102809316 [Saccoglossus kowalevskii]|uniref:arylamine N-acetyltransferase n=1 Tax=Saccoglossus kowalevskii TaxID=10224 RepID=A0ABM0LUB8_SACKO|nr:PREDICTED: uncharacterized protein LOC102809316 [Saccoglossus kowalevskii]